MRAGTLIDNEIKNIAAQLRNFMRHRQMRLPVFHECVVRDAFRPAQKRDSFDHLYGPRQAQVCGYKFYALAALQPRQKNRHKTLIARVCCVTLAPQ